MLSNFIRRNGKRKYNKVNESSSHQKSNSASSSHASSSVFNISDESPSQPAIQTSRLVELIISDSHEEWFPQELLRRSNSPESSPHRAQNAAVTQSNLTQESHSSSVLSPSRSEDVSPGVIFRKKSVPAPIFIPDTDLLLPNVQIGNSVIPSAAPPINASQSNANYASLTSFSPETSDNLSTISGTTLAHALMCSSFVLSSSDRHSSRYRSGLTRQDSATLPSGEVGFQLDSGRPPVPPVPATLPSMPNNFSPIKSGTSTESEYPTSESYITSPEIVISSVISQRTSPTQEVPSQAASTSTKASPSVDIDTTPQRKARSVPARTQVTKNGVVDVPKTAVRVSSPKNSQVTAQHSAREGPDGHGLDEIDSFSPGTLAASVSPTSDSSTSYVAPPPKRSDANRGQRRRRVGGSNLVRNGFRDNSLVGGILAHQSYGTPSATISEHDYGELLYYNLTVSPESSASSRIPSSASAGYQTFPETPTAYSPLCSPRGALLAKSDSQVLRRCPSTPKSAGLRSAKLYSMRTTRRRLDGKDGAGGAIVSRRSRSSLSPGQNTPSPKHAELNVSPLARVSDRAGIPDEGNQSSATNTVGPQNSLKVRPVVRPHPLAHISSSSSCLPEEEALQALAPHSASSLPSVIVDDALHSLMTALASVVDPSVKSSASVPLPETIDESPSNSPPLADSGMGGSPLTSPLQSSVLTATTAVSSPPSSSFLPSPSLPVSLGEVSSRPLSPIPIASSPAALHESMSHSAASVPPPPYHTIVSERTAHHPSSVSTLSLSRVSSAEQCYQCGQQASSVSVVPGSVRSRVRARPPLPIGPRKPGGPGQILGSFVPGFHGRNGSASSVGTSDTISNPGSLWRKLQSAVLKPAPRFQPPPPKWRGLTLEAAQWTFTSAQLQEMVSQAIQQASEGSSLRLLRLEVLEGEIADEMHHLELQHTDVKAQYKALVRKRWTLMGVLAGHIEGVEVSDATTVCRTMEELADVLSALDRLADKMHNIVIQLAQLKSLGDVHNASALAMAVRKINGLFIRQMAEKERLQEHVDTLQTERDEAWKHAEDIAQDYDALNDRMSEPASAVCAETQSLAGSRRSARVSAVRKSSIRLSQAGLRSRSKHRPRRSSSNATRPASLAQEDIPPVPRVRVKPLSIGSATLPVPTGTSFNSVYSCSSPTSEALALAEAQREVYEMLGLSLPPSQASSRPRTLSGHRPSSLSSRPMSDPLTESCTREQRRRGRRFYDEDVGRAVSSSTSWPI